MTFMGVLVDTDIINLGIVHYAVDRKVSELNGYKIMSYGLEPHGYTLTLSDECVNSFRVTTDYERRRHFWLDPGESMTLKCNEFIEMPLDVVGFLYPKSSYSRHGLIFSLAVVDAGFNGYLSFSVFNPKTKAEKIFINEGIIQLVCHRSKEMPLSQYGGQYQEKLSA